MILVDTTVWIDFFNNRDTSKVAQLTELISNQDDLCLCGVILTEILQGLRNPKERLELENVLNSLIFLEMTKSTFVLSADIFQTLRHRGITIRKTIDCMIAAVAIENNIPLIHNDRDFYLIEKYCGLKTIEEYVS